MFQQKKSKSDISEWKPKEFFLSETSRERPGSVPRSKFTKINLKFFKYARRQNCENVLGIYFVLGKNLQCWEIPERTLEKKRFAATGNIKNTSFENLFFGKTLTVPDKELQPAEIMRARKRRARKKLYH